MRASKRRSSRRRSSRRSLSQNPLSTKQKVGVVGGLVVVGGVAAYMLTRGDTAPLPPQLPVGPAGPSAAQCDALQASLVQLMASPTPDAGAVQRLQAQIAQCIAQVRAAGGEVSNALSDQSNGDAAFQHIEDQFADYKRTNVVDPLKRNNIRQDILRTGHDMAAAYAAAVTASTDPATTRVARQSILRALDSAVIRRICYLYDQPGCGRSGVSEDHGNDKAAQEYDQIIRPLLDAHGLAVQKLWSTGGVTAPDDTRYFATLMRPAMAANDFANAKFAEYKTVDYIDPLRRNNLRQEVLAADRAMVDALQTLVNDAIGYRNVAALRAAAPLIISGLGSASQRWLCYILDQPGCGRSGVSEDHGNDKAGQEYAAAIQPLSDIYMQAAQKLVTWGTIGDMTAYEPLITTKLSRCGTLGSYVNSKFNEYKSVDSGLDPLRKNNLRQVVLQFGGLLAACLQDAMTAALTGAAVTPTASLIVRTIVAGNMGALRTGLNLTMTAPAATSGLGLTLTPQLAPLRLTAPLTITPATPATTTPATPPTPTTDANVAAAAASGLRMVGLVMAATKTALDAAITRQLCFLYGQPGCSTFAANEDSNGDKAAQEYNTTVAPLMTALAQGTAFLVPKDPKAETLLINAKLRYCTALNDYVNAKFAEYRSVSWSDAARRNNLRVNEVMAKGRDLVACLRGTAPTTAYGRSLVKTVADAALAASRARVACYNDSSSNCGRFGVNEDDNGTKAAQETNDITNPLADIVARLSAGRALSGLGQSDSFAGISTGAWIGIGVAAFVAVGAYQSSKRTTTRNRRRRRRSSYRAVA